MASTTFQLLLVALAGVASALPTIAQDIIPGKFIVTLQPEAGHELELHTRWVSEIHARGIKRRGGDLSGVEDTFSLPGFHGYSGSFDGETLSILRANSSVLRVEEDKIVHLDSSITQVNAPWGLSTISSANPPSSDATYTYDSSAGEGTFSYILDSGILLEHVDFGGRAIFGINAHGAASNKLHGTVISGIIGGTTHGVAKKTTLIDVQVTGTDTGTISGVLRGLEWTANDAVSKGRVGKSVLNMSLGVSNSPTVNDAVQAVIDAGLPVVAAAGNSNSNADGDSPANHPLVITVGASDRNNKRAYFSNWGPSVDIFAPGVNITSASSSSATALYTSDGTSEASPHVAGVVAYLLALEGPRSPVEMRTRLFELALKDKIQDPKQSANRLLHTGL